MYILSIHLHSKIFFFFECYGDHRDLHVLTHSFPTRRSSDLARDFRTRVREAGVLVPDLAYRRGLRWLTRYVSQDPSDDHGLAVQAYAYYVLARANDMEDRKSTRLNSSH